MLVFIAFAQKPPSNGHTGVSSEVIDVRFGPTPHLHISAHVFLNYIKRVEEKRYNARLAEHFIAFSERV